MINRFLVGVGGLLDGNLNDSIVLAISNILFEGGIGGFASVGVCCDD